MPFFRRLRELIRLKKARKPIVFSLAPTIPERKSDYKAYKYFFDEAFKDKSIRNIALTGNFGTGKSSFLKWYAKRKKFLFVSLCDYSHQEKKSLTELGNEICQQLYLGCAKTQKRHKLMGCFFVFFFFVIICSIVVFLLLINNTFNCAETLYELLSKSKLIDPNAIQSSTDLVSLLEKNHYIISLSIGVISFLGIPLLATWLFSAITSAKLSVKASEIEAEMEFQKSKDIQVVDFHKVKLIEALKKAARSIDYTVVFEDFDRTDYDNCRFLFTELRELNRQINSISIWFRRKKPMRFIYVLQDDLFANESANEDTSFSQNGRTLHLKFFDYIIPFIPKTYGFAAAGVILDSLTKSQVSSECIGEYVSCLDGSLYDYRAIRNIANEYQVLRNVFIRSSFVIDRKSNNIFSNLILLCKATITDIKNLFRQTNSVPLNALPLRVEKKLLAIATFKTLMPDHYAHIRTGQTKDINWCSDSCTPLCIQKLCDNNWLDDECVIYIGYNQYELCRYLCTRIKNDSDLTSSDTGDLIESYYSLLRDAFLQDGELLLSALYRHSSVLLKMELESYPNNNLDLLQHSTKLFRGISGRDDNLQIAASTLSALLSSLSGDNCFSIVVEYVLSFCKDSNYLPMIISNTLSLDRFVQCINLSSEAQDTLYMDAKALIISYIGALSSNGKDELLQRIPETAKEKFITFWKSNNLSPELPS